MTPLQMAKAECANMQPDGSCLGCGIRDDGAPVAGKRLPACLLSGKERCLYFEGCVAPMAEWLTDPRKQKAYQTAVHLYRMTHIGAVTGRKCPECGGIMPAKKRFCSLCASKHRKATFRAAYHRRAGNGGSASTVKPKDTPSYLGNSGHFSGMSNNPYQDSHPIQDGHLTVEWSALEKQAQEI